MTLIVARTIGEKVILASDSLISGPQQDLRRPEYNLKLLIIDENLIVGYAGSPHEAHAIIGELSRELTRNDPVDVAAMLARRRRERQARELDFIFVQSGNISTIKDGEICQGVPSGWIGDQRAFSDFQVRYVDGRSPDETMREIIAARVSDVVGGPVVAASSDPTRTEYILTMELQQRAHMPLSVDEWNTIDFGSAAHGGFGYTTLTPPEAGVCGWGIYYFQASTGAYFFADVRSNRFEKFVPTTPCTLEIFVSKIADHVGYRPQFAGQLGQPFR